MREIKFRLWDDEEKIMIDGDSLAFEKYLPIKDLLSRDNIMQYTGLHDSSGKEIYEGDVLRDGNDLYNYVVYYDTKKASFRRKKINNSSFTFDCSLDKETEYKDGNATIKIKFNFKIIGNIHENPELVK